MTEIFGRTDRLLGEVELHVVELGGDQLEHMNRLGHDFDPDPISGQDRDSKCPHD